MNRQHVWIIILIWRKNDDENAQAISDDDAIEAEESKPTKRKASEDLNENSVQENDKSNSNQSQHKKSRIIQLSKSLQKNCIIYLIIIIVSSPISALEKAKAKRSNNNTPTKTTTKSTTKSGGSSILSRLGKKIETPQPQAQPVQDNNNQRKKHNIMKEAQTITTKDSINIYIFIINSM